MAFTKNIEKSVKKTAQGLMQISNSWENHFEKIPKTHQERVVLSIMVQLLTDNKDKKNPFGAGDLMIESANSFSDGIPKKLSDITFEFIYTTNKEESPQEGDKKLTNIYNVINKEFEKLKQFIIEGEYNTEKQQQVADKLAAVLKQNFKNITANFTQDYIHTSIQDFIAYELKQQKKTKGKEEKNVNNTSQRSTTTLAAPNDSSLESNGSTSSLHTNAERESIKKTKIETPVQSDNNTEIPTTPSIANSNRQDPHQSQETTQSNTPQSQKSSSATDTKEATYDTSSNKSTNIPISNNDKDKTVTYKPHSLNFFPKDIDKASIYLLDLYLSKNDKKEEPFKNCEEVTYQNSYQGLNEVTFKVKDKSVNINVHERQIQEKLNDEYNNFRNVINTDVDAAANTFANNIEEPQEEDIIAASIDIMNKFSDKITFNDDNENYARIITYYIRDAIKLKNKELKKQSVSSGTGKETELQTETGASTNLTQDSNAKPNTDETKNPIKLENTSQDSSNKEDTKVTTNNSINDNETAAIPTTAKVKAELRKNATLDKKTSAVNIAVSKRQLENIHSIDETITPTEQNNSPSVSQTKKNLETALNAKNNADQKNKKDTSKVKGNSNVSKTTTNKTSNTWFLDKLLKSRIGSNLIARKVYTEEKNNQSVDTHSQDNSDNESVRSISRSVSSLSLDNTSEYSSEQSLPGRFGAAVDAIGKGFSLLNNGLKAAASRFYVPSFTNYSDTTISIDNLSVTKEKLFENIKNEVEKYNKKEFVIEGSPIDIPAKEKDLTCKEKGNTLFITETADDGSGVSSRVEKGQPKEVMRVTVDEEKNTANIKHTGDFNLWIISLQSMIISGQNECSFKFNENHEALAKNFLDSYEHLYWAANKRFTPEEKREGKIEEFKEMLNNITFNFGNPETKEAILNVLNSDDKYTNVKALFGIGVNNPNDVQKANNAQLINKSTSPKNGRS